MWVYITDIKSNQIDVAITATYIHKTTVKSEEMLYGTLLRKGKLRNRPISPYDDHVYSS